MQNHSWSSIRSKGAEPIQIDEGVRKCGEDVLDVDDTHSHALPSEARLFHAPRAAEFPHVFAEVAVSAVGSQTRIAFSAPAKRRSELGEFELPHS